MSPLMQRCIKAARNAKACEACGGDANRVAVASRLLPTLRCDACAANVVRAVLDEFVNTSTDKK